MTKLSHDVIPSLGARYRLSIGGSTELTIIALENGDHEFYIEGEKLFTLSSKDVPALMMVLSGVLPGIAGGEEVGG